MTDSVPVPTVETRREDVVETMHGQRIVDPYRWLEEQDDPAVRDWTREQNARTQAVLQQVPGRKALEAELREALQVGSVSAAEEAGGRFFFTRREGDEAQPSLRVREGIDGAERVLVNPNELSETGLVSLDYWYPSRDGARVAYGVSESGDEWSTLRVLDVATGNDMGEAIPRARHSSVAWLPDGDGFYYTRYPDPDMVAPGQEHYNSHAFRHELGADPTQDPKVFGEGRSPQDMLRLSLDRSGRWLVVIAMQGWATSEVWVKDCSEEPIDGNWKHVAPDVKAKFLNPVIVGDTLYLLSDQMAPNMKIVRLVLAPEMSAIWETVVPERNGSVIEMFDSTQDGLVTVDLESAIAQVRLFGYDGALKGEFELPGIGTVLNIESSPDSHYVSVNYQSFLQPPSCLIFDVRDGSRLDFSPVSAPEGFATEDYVVRQVRYASRDGTEITMFVVHREGIELAGDHPTYLTGYGGFRATRGSEYDPVLPVLLRQGVVFALPNLRGGAEYGEGWHRDGMLERKQNVFDDFIGAAEWLIESGYTNSERLAIGGRSNGGLLVGAAMTQRPDLFRAVYCGVPLLDMLRFPYFRIARLWVAEYGDPEDPEAFEWIRAYSPYHNVEPETAYPALLVTTAEQDSRVDPMHARKFAALLQAETASGEDQPILLRAEENAGHGRGKPLHKRVDETADTWGFLGWQLGVHWASA